MGAHMGAASAVDRYLEVLRDMQPSPSLEKAIASVEKERADREAEERAAAARAASTSRPRSAKRPTSHRGRRASA